MKRLALCLCLAAALALAGCTAGEPAGPAAPTEPSTTETAVPTEAPTEAAAAYPMTGYVNATTLNVRPTPDTSGYAIGGLKYGDEVTILGKEGDWYQIRFKEEAAWVNAQYIQMEIPGRETAAPTASAPTASAPTAAQTTAAVVAP